jgi:hypothetical protein
MSDPTEPTTGEQPTDATPPDRNDGSTWSDTRPDVYPPEGAAPATTAPAPDVLGANLAALSPLLGRDPTAVADAMKLLASVGNPAETFAPLFAVDAARITERLRAHLASLPGGACPMCGSSEYAPYAWASVALYATPEPDAVATHHIHAIALLSPCGDIRFLSAKTAGLLPPPAATTPPEGATKE